MEGPKELQRAPPQPPSPARPPALRPLPHPVESLKAAKKLLAGKGESFGAQPISTARDSSPNSNSLGCPDIGFRVLRPGLPARGLRLVVGFACLIPMFSKESTKTLTDSE